MDKGVMIMDRKEEIKTNLFNELNKFPTFKNLAMDMQGEAINDFVEKVILLQKPLNMMEE